MYQVQANQNNFLKQLLDLPTVKPEVINQDMLPMILSQNKKMMRLLRISEKI